MQLSKSQKIGSVLVALLIALTMIANAMTRERTGVSSIDDLAGHDFNTGPQATTFAAPSTGPVSFTGHLDRTAVLRGSDGLVKMELVLAADEREPSLGTHRVPTDLLVVLDRSGSMSGDKLTRAREAVHELIGRMATSDRLALVTYESAARVLIPLDQTADQARERWQSMVRGIDTGGGTNMSAGLDVALDLAASSRGHGRATRMILISDGHANEGDSSVEGLSARAGRGSRQEIVVSAIGVGEGFDEFLMSSVADAGTGNFYYLQHSENLAQIFTNELSATRDTVASALSVTIEPGSGVEVVDAAGYPLERTDGKVVFRPGTLFAGQERRIWLTLALPPNEVGVHSLGSFVSTYRDGDRWQSLRWSDSPQVATIDDEERFIESVDEERWERAVVEEDYNRLQQRVAHHVKAGRKDEALEEISSYLATNGELNKKLESAAVAEQLEETRALAKEVEDVFVGADQLYRQNLLSKSKQASGWDGRRAGSKLDASKSGNGGQP